MFEQLIDNELTLYDNSLQPGQSKIIPVRQPVRQQVKLIVGEQIRQSVRQPLGEHQLVNQRSTPN